MRKGRVADFWIAFSNVIHQRKVAHRKSLSLLSLGEPTLLQTMTYWRKL
jgi:hypothetical protein